VLEGASARRARRAAWWNCVPVCVVASLLASASFAEIVVQGTQATFRWSPALGAVSGYQILVSRNGGGMVDGGTVTTTEATLSGRVGDVIQVAVRAWGYPNGAQAGIQWGPVSALSEGTRFSSGALAETQPVLNCWTCMRLEIFDMTGSLLASLAHPSGGSWDVVAVDSFDSSAPPRSQALLRDRNNGALWIGDVRGNQLVHYASVLGSDFSQDTVRAADLDGDGTAEVVLYNSSSGRVEIWSFQNAEPVQRLQWSGPIGWRLIGVGDLDGDRQGDLWFDAGGGVILVARFRLYTFVGSMVLSVPVGNMTALDVADYDGDWIADTLWRDSTGGLKIAFTTGSPSSPDETIVTLASQSGDQSVLPTASVDLDNDGAAEVLLEDTQTGATFAAFPLDAVPGRRMLLPGPGDPSWWLVTVK